MDIAIIGAGNVGKALGGSLVRAGHNVTFAATNPEHAAAAASDSPAPAPRRRTTKPSMPPTSSSSPFRPPPSRPSRARSATRRPAKSSSTSPTGRPRIPPVPPRPSPRSSRSSSPGSKVVKAFNTAFASRQADPSLSGIAADGFVAGDDETAKQTVLEIVESIGFRPVDAGSLAAARTLEGMAWLNINRALAGGSWQDAWVLVGPDAPADPSRN